MSYIGRQLNNLSDRVKLDSITASATATYNLLLNTVAYVPSSAESLTVSLNGVIQAPQDSYTVSGSQITFASALTSSDSIDFILAERSITLQTPSSGSVNTEQLANSSVTNTKVASSVITSQTEKTSLVDADKFLISDSADSNALKYVQKSNLGAGQWVLLQTTTVTSTTGNVDFNNVFDSTYKNYVLLGSEIRGDVDNKILCRFGTGSTPTFDSTSNYARVVSYVTSAGSDTIKHSTTDTGVLVTPNATDTSDGDMSFRMVFPEPQNTSRRLQVYFEGTQYDGAMTYYAGTGRCDNIPFATPVTSVRYTPNTGAGFDSGTFKLYGVK